MTKAEETAAEIRDNGGIAHAFQGNVADLESMKCVASEAASTFEGIDVLCANAGIFPNATIEEMTGEHWDQVMNTNARGTLFSLQACLPFLKQAEYGRIIVTSSITGPATGYAGWSHYGASKAAQLGFMRSAALELARYNITINAVMPGNIMTEGLEGLGDHYLQAMTASIPLQRLGSVEDIAYAALFWLRRRLVILRARPSSWMAVRLFQRVWKRWGKPDSTHRILFIMSLCWPSLM